jgi:threonine dehydrogenase-like Zn-dependent dehydrogenase
VDTVPDPKIEHPRDAVIKITACAICGSDLHLFDGYQPTMESGDILGHENMGEVIELGSEVTNLNIGDRVVVPFTISCGNCWFCQRGLFSCCDRTNPNAEIAAKAMGQSPAGLFGFSHMLGGYSGGQAEYLRVPMADIGPIKIPHSITDEQALFLSDIFPTGYMAAVNAQIQPGDTVAIWGCGPSASSRSAPLSCWELGASLPSTKCRSVWQWPKPGVPKSSISRRRTSMRN